MKFYTRKDEPRSLPYGDYGRLVSTPIATTARPEAPTPTIIGPRAHMVGVVPKAEAAELGQSNPNLKDVDKGTAKIAGGAGLVVAGIAGGAALALFGGGLSTGLKVLSGVASAAAGTGGAAIAAQGLKERTQSESHDYRKARLTDLLGGVTPSGEVSPGDVADLSTFDDPDHSRIFVGRRMHFDTPCEISVRPRAGLWLQGDPRWKPYGELGPDPVLAHAWLKSIKGLNLDQVPPGAAECESIWSQNKVGPIGSAPNVVRNTTRFYDPSERMICEVKMWRYGAKGWDHQWQPGTFRGGPEEVLSWGGHYGTGNFSTVWDGPPHGVIFSGITNARLIEVAAVLGNPTNPLPPAEDEYEFPLQAMVQMWQALRGYSPEVTMMYSDPVSLAAAFSETAKKVYVPDAWERFWNVVGKVIGVTAYVCEVALPIITAINPAVGAFMSRAVNIAEMGITEVREMIRHSEDFAVDFYNNIGEVFENWTDYFTGSLPEFTLAGRLFGELPDVEKYAYMVEGLYRGANSQIINRINIADNMPFYVNRVFSYSTPRVGDIEGYFTDPAVWAGRPPPGLLRP